MTCDNLEARRAAKNIWMQKNRDKYLESRRARYRKQCETNIEKIRASRLKYAKPPSTPHQRAHASIQSGLSAFIRGKNRPRVIGLIACSRDELMSYLELQFQPGWTWNDYGKLFEIDHIKPCREFDLSDPVQQRICYHYTNLRPREKSANRAWRREAA